MLWVHEKKTGQNGTTTIVSHICISLLSVPVNLALADMAQRGKQVTIAVLVLLVIIVQ